MIALSLRNKVKQLHTRNNQNVKPQASDGKQKLTKAQVEKQVDPMLLDQKMASCSEEKKKRLETHLTVTGTVHAQRCKCGNSKTNTEQSTNQSWHRNSMRREQHRKANSTLQKTNSARTTSYPSNPIAKRAMLSHAADTLCSPANYSRDYVQT